MKKLISINTIFILLVIFYSETSCRCLNTSDKTTVLIVGTIHYQHYKNAGYSFHNLFQIIETFNPDVICVEIRPEDFRKTIYLDEMTSASIYGIKRKLKVYPIDWWDGDANHNTRTLRDEYMKTEEYKEKLKVENEKVKSNQIIQTFEKKYGDWDSDILDKQNYEFYNGKEYNNYIEERYKVSMEVYGDHPMNLGYETRNTRMMELINKAVDENQGKRILVLTGAEHKHFFDNALAGYSKIKLTELTDILPLKNCRMDNDVEVFLLNNRANYYLDTTTKIGSDNYFQSQLVPLVHGPDMDFKPKIIPRHNIRISKIILDEWEAEDSVSIGFSYEKGWYLFLSGDYEKAVNNFKKVVANLNNFYQDQLKYTAFRNIAISYELLNNKEEANKWFQQGEQYADQNNIPEMVRTAGYEEYPVLKERNKKVSN